jgi:hypothetical protein
MTHSFKKHAILVTGLLMGLAISAYAQQPPDVVQSDSNQNTAMGTGALSSEVFGAQYNTATGFSALTSNTGGSFNTATGRGALYSNTIGMYNTATGYQALAANTIGDGNTAVGYQALNSNNNVSNSAFGDDALSQNNSGYENVAFGVDTLVANVAGNDNTAVGTYALQSNTGSDNIGVGASAGGKLTTGSSNIAIGNPGTAGESGIIRIGVHGTQTATYIAGIINSRLDGRHVVISDEGRLGVEGSSERFKTEIAPMGSNTAKIDELRPVTFRLKTNPYGPIHYGLIAEEVAKVYPELVTRDADGKLDGVRYEELAPMLLNEVQKQQRINAAQADRNNTQAAKIASLEQQLAGIQAALVKLQPEDQLVAQR